MTSTSTVETTIRPENGWGLEKPNESTRKVGGDAVYDNSVAATAAVAVTSLSRCNQPEVGLPDAAMASDANQNIDTISR